MPDFKDEILNSISLEGAASEENKSIKTLIASKSHSFQILDTSSGLPRIRHSVTSKFDFILRQPLVLSSLSPLSIRCCLCGKIISYPAFYYSVRYAINQIHYFICFNDNSDKVSAKCYRKA